MRISIWQQFSSNHSSDFTIVGVFETTEAAQSAATEVRQMIETVKAFWDEHPNDSDNKYSWAEEAPTPPEVEFGQRFGFKWPGAVEWYYHASITVVLDRFVCITPAEGFRPDTAGEPFNQVLTSLGGHGLLHGDIYGHRVGTILIEINCTAPDESTAQEILLKYLSYDLFGESEGRHLHFYKWSLSDFDFPEIFDYLSEKGCVDIQCGFTQSEDPLGKTITAGDADVLIRILESGSLWNVRDIAFNLRSFGDTRTVGALLHALSRAEPDEKIEIATALGDFRDPRIADALVDLLNDNASRFAAPAAVKSLAKIGDQRAIEPLVKFLESAQSWTSFALALARFGNIAREAVLQSPGLNAPAMNKRRAYTLGLMDMVAGGSIAGFIVYLDDDDPIVAANAASAFGEFKETRGIQPLIRFLAKDPDLLHWQSVAWALAGFGSAAREALLKSPELDSPTLTMRRVYTLNLIDETQGAVDSDDNVNKRTED